VTPEFIEFIPNGYTPLSGGRVCPKPIDEESTTHSAAKMIRAGSRTVAARSLYAASSAWFACQFSSRLSWRAALAATRPRIAVWVGNESGIVVIKATTMPKSVRSRIRGFELSIANAVVPHPSALNVAHPFRSHHAAFWSFIAATSSFEPEPQRESALIACVKGTSTGCTRSGVRI
jgi:hypothetical protein